MGLSQYLNDLLQRWLQGNLAPEVTVTGGGTCPAEVEVTNTPLDVSVTNDSDDPLSVADDLVRASQEGRGICRWVNNKSGVATLTVLTDGPVAGPPSEPGIYYNIPSGKQVRITKACFQLITASDDCNFRLVAMDAVNGGGNKLAYITPIFTIKNGAAFTGFQGTSYDFYLSPIVKYSDGVRSISVEVEANDASATIHAVWQGIVEDET